MSSRERVKKERFDREYSEKYGLKEAADEEDKYKQWKYGGVGERPRKKRRMNPPPAMDPRINRGEELIIPEATPASEQTIQYVIPSRGRTRRRFTDGGPNSEADRSPSMSMSSSLSPPSAPSSPSPSPSVDTEIAGKKAVEEPVVTEMPPLEVDAVKQAVVVVSSPSDMEIGNESE